MNNLNNIPKAGNFGDVADKLNDNFNKVNIAVETINSKYVRNKGYFPTLAALQTAFPSPKNGDTAYVANVASSSGYYIANVVGGAWVETTTVAPPMSINANEYAKHGYSTTPKTLKQVDDSKAESGGSAKTLKEVDDEIVQLESEFSKIIIPDISGYIGTNGNIGSGAGIHLVTDFERYTEGDINITGYEAASAKFLFFYDRYFQPISYYITTVGIKTNMTIPASEIPNGTFFVRSHSRVADNNGKLILQRKAGDYIVTNEEYITTLLLLPELDNTIATPVFDTNGLPVTVTHRNMANIVVRTDSFIFSDIDIQETRTMMGISKVFTTELSTLKTTIL